MSQSLLPWPLLWRMSRLLFGVILLAELADASDCAALDGACSTHDSNPAVGEALLQRHAHREHSAPVHRHLLKQQKSADNANNTEELPPGAFQLFDEKLCKKSSSTEMTSSDRSNSSDRDEHSESAHDEMRKEKHSDMTHAHDEIHHGTNSSTSSSAGDRSMDTMGLDGYASDGSKAVAEKENAWNQGASADAGDRSGARSAQKSGGSKKRKRSHKSRRGHEANSKKASNDNAPDAHTLDRPIGSRDQPYSTESGGQRSGSEEATFSLASQDSDIRPRSVAQLDERRTSLVSNGFDSAFMMNWEGDDLVATNAALNDAGLKKVAALKKDEEMKLFIKRVASSCSMKITNDGGLNGMIPWFNGNEAESSFQVLKESLFKSLLADSEHSFVSVRNQTGISGSTASLDLVGYAQVRALRKAPEMIKFVKRMIENMGIRITDNGGFEGLMSYYSEPDSSGSFAKLMSEIKRAAYEHAWAEID